MKDGLDNLREEGGEVHFGRGVALGAVLLNLEPPATKEYIYYDVEKPSQMNIAEY